ncbi:MAG TPA: PaaI family thioesterase [Candidatus Atribacteria bacterium]|nr:PaaI family thioesterase [Candidatus Atribacteria bacterium]
MNFVDDNNCLFCGSQNPYGFHLVFRQEDSFTVTETTVPWYYQGFKGVVHGGIIAALLDEVMSHSLKNAGIEAVTGTLEARYIKPLLTEKPLITRGQIVKKEGRIIETQGEVIQGGEVVARGKGVFVVPRERSEKNG